MPCAQGGHSKLENLLPPCFHCCRSSCCRSNHASPPSMHHVPGNFGLFQLVQACLYQSNPASLEGSAGNDHACHRQRCGGVRKDYPRPSGHEALRAASCPGRAPEKGVICLPPPLSGPGPPPPPFYGRLYTSWPSYDKIIEIKLT